MKPSNHTPMMNELSPKRLALLAALLVSLFMAAAFGLLNIWMRPAANWWLLPALVVLVFPVAYLVFAYVMDRFIYNKIRLIYKTIHELKVPRGERPQSFSAGPDIIRQANQEVMDWASDKKKEIDDLKRLEAYRREFLGNVSHELKTPIFNIQGYVLTLLDGALDDPGINRIYLLRTEQSINRMISIVQDLETIARLESGEVMLEKACFDMVELAGEVMDELDMEAGRKGIRFVFGRNAENPVMVIADRKKIQQVLTNLMVNSIKYGTENGRTKVSFFDMDRRVLTEVTDSGIGIPREELPRVFERFYRGEKSRSRQFGQGGSGLGLAIVKHIIEAHRQTINVRSTAGVGTTFAFTLDKG